MFWIDSLTVKGVGRTTSIVTFEKGLNIIHGRSNTGKTYIIACIDYMFGGKTLPFAPTTKYDTILLKIESEEGSILLTRKLGEKSIEIVSHHQNIESGTYKLSGKLALADVFLKLMGIDEVPLIISSQEYKTQKLSWRNILHMFLVTEERIIRKSSVLVSEQGSAETPTISALTYLATGQNFSDVVPRESMNIVKIKKQAVQFYIHEELKEISQHQQKLRQTENEFADIVFEGELDETTHDLLEIQERITEALKCNQQVLNNISTQNERYAECSIMKKRYLDLRTQYISD